MRNLVINNILSFIKNNNPNMDEKQAEIIKYGLVSIYLLITKLIVICIIATILGIVKELFIFIAIYSIIRLPSFGIHATKSWICLIASTIMFIGAPIICMNIIIPNSIKLILGGAITLFILKNSPADTHKRPIVDSKRRKLLKIISTIISIIFVCVAVLIKDNFISNCFIISITCQSLLISPTTYKIFRLPYNNYKNYTLETNE